jgi:hypothetical protein
MQTIIFISISSIQVGHSVPPHCLQRQTGPALVLEGVSPQAGGGGATLCTIKEEEPGRIFFFKKKKDREISSSK